MSNGTTQTADPSTSSPTPTGNAPWQQTACILCECNCGIEVRVGVDQKFERIRGDKAHPASEGYTCEKALRLDHYQNGTIRLTSPLRRRDDGTFEEIDWDTAVSEIAARFRAISGAHGGESIFYYGGGGQGNHLGGGYGGATMRALGGRYKSNALAQEKTGEFWVDGQMFGGGVRGDFEHCEVAVFLGKNPYQSHSIPRARTQLKEIARDPKRAMIVIDPRRTETAELADFHLQVKPGGDAWLMTALAAVMVQERLVATDWVNDHVDNFDAVADVLRAVPIADHCRKAGVDEALVRGAARRMAAADSVAVFEDLGVQQGLHSTLVSYLEKLSWVMTGNFAKLGAQYRPTSLVDITANRTRTGPPPVSPVLGERIISGLVPSNIVADEILTDHPKRYRAMLVESANPAHSIADSPRMREALRALELLVVIDISMTETAREAHYILPASSQFEKAEATFFNFDFPRNVFHLRHPLMPPRAGTLPEPEIHARLVEALGVVTDADVAPLRAAAAIGRAEFAAAFFTAISDPRLAAVAPVLMYRGLGPSLPTGLESAALLWGAAHRCAQSFPESLRRAGIEGDGLELGENLFEAILASPSGLTFSIDEADASWGRLHEGRIDLLIPELLDMIPLLAEQDLPHDPAFPLILSAGERRSFTANTILRDPTWRKRDAEGALRISPDDAERIGLVQGGMARITTKRASAEVTVEITPTMRDGHVSLPNGLGLDYPGVDGAATITGVGPNELTSSDHRDPIAGTPFHKRVPARVEPVS